jgi:citrate synthase
MNTINMRTNAWVSAATALSILKVRPQTLYANVSRRRIRARPDPDDSRRSLYHAGDLSRLAARRRGRPSHERVAAETASWGKPILASAISTVAGGRLWYRGQDAVAFAEQGSLEDVAALLWECAEPPAGREAMRRIRNGNGDVQAAIFNVLATRAAADAPILGRAPELLKVDAARLFVALSDSVLRAICSGGRHRTSSASGKKPRAMQLHERLATAWQRPGSADSIRRALVLLADHELNASTFATRIAASTGAPLAACLLAGFSTLSGPLHGAASLTVRRLIDGVASSGSAASIRAHLEAGSPLPAFGHPLYPEGDIRAHALLRSVRLPMAYSRIRKSVEAAAGELPNVDFALAAMTAAARLPEDAGLVIFALGRSVGWIAHALEQARAASLIRPRARYAGPDLNYGRDGRTPSAARSSSRI